MWLFEGRDGSWRYCIPRPIHRQVVNNNDSNMETILNAIQNILDPTSGNELFFHLYFYDLFVANNLSTKKLYYFIT